MKCTDEYINLLIIQYRDKTKALSHVQTFLNKYNEICNLFKSFDPSFDVDYAIGNQLDILGRIVGIGRVVSNVIPKRFFGFSEDPLSLAFGDGAFYRLYESVYTDTELSDEDYRFFIKAKIIKNFTDGVMMGGSGIQSAISFLFNNQAFLVDNKNMTATLYVSDTLRHDRIDYVRSLELIPLPHGVGIDKIIKYSPHNTFGFAENPTSMSFGEGKFARII